MGFPNNKKRSNQGRNLSTNETIECKYNEISKAVSKLPTLSYLQLFEIGTYDFVFR
jgi:hypothetical protein